MKRSEKLYEEIKYYVWCLTFEQNPKMCETRGNYRDYVATATRHLGDCTKEPMPCSRCMLINIEIKAETILNCFLGTDIGWCKHECLTDCHFNEDEK